MLSTCCHAFAKISSERLYGLFADSAFLTRPFEDTNSELNLRKSTLTWAFQLCETFEAWMRSKALKDVYINGERPPSAEPWFTFHLLCPPLSITLRQDAVFLASTFHAVCLVQQCTSSRFRVQTGNLCPVGSFVYSL